MSWRDRCLQLAAWSRIGAVQKWAAQRALISGEPFDIPESSSRVLFAGDINFDSTIRRMWNLGLYRVRFQDSARGLWQRLRRKLWFKFVQPMLSPEYSTTSVDQPFDELWIERPAESGRVVADHFADTTRRAEVDWAHAASDWDFSFRKIAPFLQSKEIVVVNLETPLSSHPRDNGLFKSDPNYAAAMKRAGITAANVSNNHIFDAGEVGFFDTLTHLRAAGIECLGVGQNLEDARKGRTLEVGGTGISCLCYTQFCNSRFGSLATTEAGILPLDRKLMTEDIKRAKDNADLVVVSLHWGLENQPNVHPAQVELAHVLVDAGADCLIGHHPHVPHAVEVYRNCPIFYSLGNFIFGQRNHSSWEANFLCELVIERGELAGAVIHPIASKGGALFVPELMNEADGTAWLKKLQIQSLPFQTRFAIRDGKGLIPLKAVRGGSSVLHETAGSLAAVH